MDQKVAIQEIASYDVGNLKLLTERITAGSSEVDGGYKAIEDLAEMARRENKVNAYDRAEGLAGAALAQLKKWQLGQGPNFRARPTVWLAAKAGHLLELEAHLRLTRADSYIHQHKPREAEGDLSQFMDIIQSVEGKRAISDLTPYGLDLLVAAKVTERDWEQASTVAEVQIERCRESSDSLHLSRALAFLAEAQSALGKVAASSSSLSEANEIATKLNDDATLRLIEQVRARISLENH